MANVGSILTSDSPGLNIGDYLTSPNQCFIAILQGDGNFCTYAGSPGNTSKALSASGGDSPPGDGQYFLKMQTDGNLEMYNGTTSNPTTTPRWNSETTQNGVPPQKYYLQLNDDASLSIFTGTPTAPGKQIWNWGNRATVTGVLSISNIAYDTDPEHCTSTPLGKQDVFWVTGDNPTSTPAQWSISKVISLTYTSSWSNSLGITLGTKVSFEAGIPALVDGKVEVSMTISDTFTWGATETETVQYTVTAGPVTLQPNEAIKATIITGMAAITVPYTLSGVLQLSNGFSCPGTVRGTYSGKCPSECYVKFTAAAQSSALNEKTMPATLKQMSAAAQTAAAGQPLHFQSAI